MPIQRHEVDFETLPADVLERWRGVPPAIVSDCMNRSNVMAAAIKPVAAGMQVIGQARTVTCMVGDNSAVHMAIGMIGRGEVLVVDAGGYEDTAVWGGIMTRAALQRGLAGLVVDGAVRDVAEIREFGFPCFARATVPAGPHKGFGGIIDGPISCAGCPVKPGDLVLGDDDGVCVVPLERAEELLAASLDKIAQEERINANTAAGGLPGDGLGLPEPEIIGGQSPAPIAVITLPALHDNIKIDRNRLAKSNAEMVSCVTEVCAEFDRHAARPAEASALLGLPAA